MAEEAHLEHTIATELTCNCLLPVPPAERGSRDCGGSGGPDIFVACYDLETRKDGDKEVLHRIGGAALYSEAPPESAGGGGGGGAAAAPLPWQKAKAVAGLPGVFDVVWVGSRYCAVDSSAIPPAEVPRRLLLAASTDGAVHILHPATLQTLRRYDGIHPEMLTSCTPFLDTSSSSLQLLCTAHTGATVVYDTVREAVVCELEGHEYDAWCGAVMPTGDVTSVTPEAAAAGPPPLLLSGGDEGMLKLYDVRAGYRACARAQFSAGVVHVAPVVSTTHEAGGAAPGAAVLCGATPYVLVGSYDESLSLIDTRFVAAAPVAQRTSLGGGVWRCSRCLFPFFASDSGGSDGEEGNLSLLHSSMELLPAAATVADDARVCGVSTVVSESNCLVLPLMQRGAALLPYNVRAPAEEVFGLPQYLHRDGEAAALTHEAVSERTLVYDAIPLSVRWEGDGGRRYRARIATSSFYEKRIDVWALNGGWTTERALPTAEHAANH